MFCRDRLFNYNCGVMEIKLSQRVHKIIIHESPRVTHLFLHWQKQKKKNNKVINFIHGRGALVVRCLLITFVE